MRRILLPLVLLALATAPALRAEAKGAEAPKKGPAKAAAAPRALIKTSMGDIEVELWPDAAPKTVEVFLGLAEGKGTFTDVRNPKQKVTLTKPFYDGLTFHRVIQGFMLQGGCPRANGSGDAGFKFADEMNAVGLGLDKLKIVNNNQPHPWLNVRSQQDLNQRIIAPIVRSMGITSAEQFRARQAEINKKIFSMTLKEFYEVLGFRYSTKLRSRKPTRGTLALANAGPNTNGSQFFINVGDPVYLTGKHTVFGRVVKGMDVVDKIAGVKTTGQRGKPPFKPLEPVTIISIRAVK
ncbi:MAG: peptidylprolyl isomerase [Planctomycetota bacterium]|nr:peptidylprolyl isomerase [Planctomycetota bacterium]